MCACWHLVADDSFFPLLRECTVPFAFGNNEHSRRYFQFHVLFSLDFFFFLVYEIPRMGTILLKVKVNTERVGEGSHFSYQHRLLRFFLLTYSFCVLGQFLPAFEYVSSLSFSIAFAPALGG